MARVSQGKDAAAQDAASKMLTRAPGRAWRPGIPAPSRRGRAGAVLIAAAQMAGPSGRAGRDAQPGPSRWSAANEPGEDGIRIKAICPGGMHRVTAILVACVRNTPRPATMTARSGASRPLGAAAAAVGCPG
jgi:hypothetical protein